MGEVVDFSGALSKRDAPDTENVVRIDGTDWYRFSAVYAADGTEFGITFLALDMEDARRRVRLIKESLTLMGQIMSVEE